jgi:hypothetical protein
MEEFLLGISFGVFIPRIIPDCTLLSPSFTEELLLLDLVWSLISNLDGF